jgi:two-component system, OmpR family, response regulator
VRVLVVEDEPKMATLIHRALQREGLAVDVAADGDRAVHQATAVPYDVILLDRMLPGIDGAEVCRRLRAVEVRVPILMLTAMGEIPHRVEGLDAGADDYLTKPFSLDELLARVRALVRRGPVTHAPVLEVGALRLKPATHEAWRDDEALVLTAKEFALLDVLMRHPGQVLSKDVLLDHVWDAASDARSNVVEAQISALREKVDRPFGENTIETVRGVGYRLRRP